MLQAFLLIRNSLAFLCQSNYINQFIILFFNFIEFENMYSLYTFIQVSSKPQLPISLFQIEEYPQILKLMEKITNFQEQNFREIYQLLYQFLSVQQQTKGPKRFAKLIQNIADVLLLHSKNQLEKNLPQNIILNLTYYQKYCSKYQSVCTQAKILVIFAICNWKMNLLDIAMLKIEACKKIISVYKRQLKKNDYDQLTGISQILEGIVCFKMDKIKIAQIILTKVTNQCTSYLTAQIKVKNQLHLRIVMNLCISLYFLSQIHYSIGKNDIAAYQLTKSVELAKQYLKQEALPFCEKMERDQNQKKNMTIKLSRTESKIQQISMIKRHKLLYKREFSKRQQLFAEPIKFKKQEVDQQLENIFILKEKDLNQHRLKQITLNFLSKQKIKINGIIMKKKLEYKYLDSKKNNFEKQFRIKETKFNISNKQKQVRSLKKQLEQVKWQGVGALRKTKIVQRYFKGLLQIEKYLRLFKIYEFAYGGLISQAQLKLIILVRKWRFNRKMIVLRKVIFRNILHLMEVEMKVVNGQKRFKLKVYQIKYVKNKADAVKAEVQITQKQCQILRQQPFYNIFAAQKNSLIRFSEQIKRKGWITMIYCLKFLKRLKEKQSHSKKPAIYQKRNVKIAYDQSSPVFEAIFFLTISDTHQDQENNYRSFKSKYFAKIEQVSMSLYKNKLYNFKIFEQIELLHNFITDKKLIQIVLAHFSNIWNSKVSQIIKIQSLFRKLLSKKLSNQQKKNINVATYIANKCLFTLIHSKWNNIFTIENFNNNTIHIQRGVKIANLRFMDRIIQKVNSTDNSRQKYKRIQRYIKMKEFAAKLFSRAKSLNFFTDFQTNFRKKLCFCKKFSSFLFRGRFIQGNIIFSMTVQSFDIFPRPYRLRIFTYESNTYQIDAQIRVFNKQMVLLEQNLNQLDLFIQIKSKKEVKIRQTPIKVFDNTDFRMIQRKGTFLSERVFSGSQQTWKNKPKKTNLKYRVQKANQNVRTKHKQALRETQIINFRKWMNDNDVEYEQSSISKNTIQEQFL